MAQSRLSEAESATPSDEHVKFSKVLWRKQPFPDNHVPDTFLAELRTNSNVRLVPFAELVFASLTITQHFLSVMLFVALFVHLRTGSLDPETTLLASTLVIAIAWGAVKAADHSSPQCRSHRQRRGGSNLLGLLILCLVLLAVSPVLRTLTESTTSDSIWALSAILFGLNLTLADYSSMQITRKSVAAPGSLSETLSLNAAICASVVLASRLQTNIQVFTLLYLAISLFALFPMLRRSIRQLASTKHTTSRSPSPNICRLNLMLASTLYVAAMLLMRPYSVTTCALTTMTVLFLSIGCPAWMRWAQNWKDEMKGPWDPAEPVITSKKYT